MKWLAFVAALAGLPASVAAPTSVYAPAPDVMAAYERAAQAGNIRAQAVLGFLYQKSRPDDALRWLQAAARQGDTDCQVATADFLRDRGRYSSSAFWYSRAALHSKRAAYELGTLYENGDGVAQSYREAVRLYRRAAVSGFADAENRLGNLYMIGGGVRQDYGEARRWYLKAAAQGHGEALLNLAGLFFQGLGVRKNVDEALGWAHAAKRVRAREAEAFLAVIEAAK